MDHIGRSLPKLKTNFPISRYFRQAHDRRRYVGFLPLDSVLWLVMFFFVCQRVYSLLAIDERQRSLSLRAKARLLSFVLPREPSPRRLQKLRERHREDRPILSDSQLRRLVCGIDPAELRPALQAMTMKARRDKTWAGRPKVGVYDGTKEGGSGEKICPLCKPKGDGCFHLGVHLVQISEQPYFSMDYEPVPRGENELTAANRMARRQVKAARGRYLDVVVVDLMYASSGFVDYHRERGMDVILRGEEKDTDSLPGNMNVFQDAASVFAMQEGPDAAFTDARRDRRVRIWDETGFRTWTQLEGPIRVLKMVIEELKGETTRTYWLLTTCAPEAYSARAIYRWSVRRWRIENNVFRREKTAEAFTHRQVHDASGDGFTVFRILLLIAMNLVNWLAWRRLPSVSHRLKKTPYAFRHFRADLVIASALFLYGCRCADIAGWPEAHP